MALTGVSERTIDWYEDCFAAWRRHSDGNDYKNFIINLRNKGTSAISVNTYIRGMNAYFKWAGENIKIGYLKEEQKILATLNPEHVRRLVHWKPVGRNETRAHTIALVALDSGLRISELLGLTRQDVDLDNLVLLVHGKGNKQRLVPMSAESPQGLVPAPCQPTASESFLYPKRQRPDGAELGAGFYSHVPESRHHGRENFLAHPAPHLQGFLICARAATPFYLSKILGHTSVKTTEWYLQSLGIEDLQAVHDGLSLLRPNVKPRFNQRRQGKF